MVSDDERRRVAEGLRGLNGDISHVRRVYEDEGFSILCDDQADYYQICHAVAGYLPAEHMHPCDYEELHTRLADLIEPSCDRDALLALASGLEADADRILRAARSARFGGGPRVGEAKHDAYEWRSIARRIREALGVSDDA